MKNRLVKKPRIKPVVKTKTKPKIKLKIKIPGVPIKGALPATKKEFPIVGIGASAGGLEAFIQLIKKVPVNSDMAYVLVQHLAPNHPSLSVNIISKATKLKVMEVVDQMKIEPNCVYVIPPNHSMQILDGTLKLLPRPDSSAQHMSIDIFFESLALEKKNRAIGVVLSGTGTDGTLGLQAIQGKGGITCVQEPKTAKFDGMPQSAITSGVADLVLPPQDIAAELARLALHLSNNKIEPEDEADEADEADENNSAKITVHHQDIFNQLRSHTNVDFSSYKNATINRRIQRRILLLKIKNLEAYAKYLPTHPQEITALYNDLLINVTEFFRDPDSYKILTSVIFPKMLKDRDVKEPIRIWIPGCSTGEEVYSIAIILIEFLEKSGAKNALQIFATDISDYAIKKARAGYYSESIERNVSKSRLENFFDKFNDGYKVRKSVRDLCIFSHHDMTRDPPIAKLDLISCRNVMIYFGSILQKRIIPIFHYALKPKGFLWLGKSESASSYPKLFHIEDKTHKFYSKKNSSTPMSFHFPVGTHTPNSVASSESTFIGDMKGVRTISGPDYQKDADRLILEKFSPPAVIVNTDMEVIQIRGQCAPFLEPALSNNLFKMIRPELLAGLRTLAAQVKKENKPLKKHKLHLKNHNRNMILDLEIVPMNPLAIPTLRNYLVFFETTGETLPLPKNQKHKKDFREQQITEILHELAQTKETQQILVDQYEAAQEELSAANEEMQSANEELQSTNEELETAKEELQSTNEELVTVNDELQIRNNDLTTLGNDLSNLLSSTEIPILMIGQDKRIRRFTPEAETAFNIITTDIGRPIGDIKSNFGLEMDSLIEEVMKTQKPMELEVQDRKGIWKRLQIRSYKTIDRKVDGVIIALDDIDLLKRKEKSSKANFEYVTSIADTVPFPIAVLDLDFKLQSVNFTFYKYFKIEQSVLEQDLFKTLGISQEYLNPLTKLFTQSIAINEPIVDFEIDCVFPRIGRRKLHLSGGKVVWKSDGLPLVLLSFVDFTERARMEEERSQLLIQEKDARNEAEKANSAKDIFLATLSHELRTPLSAILPWAQLIQLGKIDGEKVKYGASIIEQSVKIQSQLIDDLLDVSRMIAGKLSMEIKQVSLAEVIRLAVESVQPLVSKKSIHIKTTLSPESRMILGDHMRLQQIIWNLLTNAIKFSNLNGQIDVSLDYIDQQNKPFARIIVRDYGKGIPQKFLSSIFTPFSQADGASTRVHGGLGLGLSIVKKLAELQGGVVTAENQPQGKGAIFTVTFPVIKATNAITPNNHNRPHSRYGENLTKNIIVEQPRLDGMRILFVDDQESVREAINIYLKSFGAEVIAVESVQDALKSMTTVLPSIIVTDIAMPIEDGYDLLYKIRALSPEAGGTIPVIALSAYASQDDADRTRAAGFHALVAKPVEANNLGYAILNVVKKKGPSA